MPSGSKPGERRGGRVKGTPNHITAEQRRHAAESGLMPLEYMLQVMRNDDAEPSRRDDMAKAAASYLHPKLAAIEHTGKDGGPIETDNTHHGEIAVSPFDEFLDRALGGGTASLLGGSRPN